MDLTDIEILQKLKQGDKSVFDNIFREHYAVLVGYSRKFVSNINEAEEIVQELFVNFWDKKDSIDINTSLKSYLFRSVHNMCLNQIKHKIVKNKFDEYYLRNNLNFSTDTSDFMDVNDLIKKIDRALEEMPVKVRTTFQLIRFEEMKYREVADKLGISVKTVEAHMGIALKFMRQYLKEYIAGMIFLCLYLF